MAQYDTKLSQYPHSGSAYYLTVTIVVLVSLVAMTNESVCQGLALLTILTPDVLGAAPLAFHGL